MLNPIPDQWSATSHFDLAAYEKYLGGKLEDCKYPESKVKEAQANLPDVE